MIRVLDYETKTIYNKEVNISTKKSEVEIMQEMENKIDTLNDNEL